jgi:hypothetical protein
MLLQAVSDLGLDPARCAILGDKISDIEAGAAAGIARRVLIGPRHAKTGGPPYEVVADLGEAPVLRQLCLISAPGIPDARPFKLELGFAAVQWNRRTVVCPRLTVLGAA